MHFLALKCPPMRMMLIVPDKGNSSEPPSINPPILLPVFPTKAFPHFNTHSNKTPRRNPSKHLPSAISAAVVCLLHRSPTTDPIQSHLTLSTPPHAPWPLASLWPHYWTPPLEGHQRGRWGPDQWINCRGRLYRIHHAHHWSAIDCDLKRMGRPLW